MFCCLGVRRYAELQEMCAADDVDDEKARQGAARARAALSRPSVSHPTEPSDREVHPGSEMASSEPVAPASAAAVIARAKASDFKAAMAAAAEAAAEGGGRGDAASPPPPPPPPAVSAAAVEATEDAAPPSDEAYTWRDEGDDVVVRFALAPGARARDVRCVIARESLRVELAPLGAAAAGGWAVALDDVLFGAVDVDESTWQLESPPPPRKAASAAPAAPAGPTLVVELRKVETTCRVRIGCPNPWL